MADLAQLDLRPKGNEARIRALLEDLAEYHMGIYPQNRLALAVWFAKSPESEEYNVLELFSGLPKHGIVHSRFPLLWKTASEGPPFVNVSATSVDDFSKLLKANPGEVDRYRDRYEVLYFDKRALPQDVLEAFQIITEPPGLLKGWYVPASEYAKSENIQTLLSIFGGVGPEIGLVKTEESPDFEYCRGLLHVEITPKWLPLSAESIRAYSFYNDQQSGQPVYFLFEGGSLYLALKFEVKTAPEYASRLLGKTRDDRYPQVYLRAVRPPAQPAASAHSRTQHRILG